MRKSALVKLFRGELGVLPTTPGLPWEWVQDELVFALDDAEVRKSREVMVEIDADAARWMGSREPPRRERESTILFFVSRASLERRRNFPCSLSLSLSLCRKKRETLGGFPSATL